MLKSFGDTPLNIVVIGANGGIGSALISLLKDQYPSSSIHALSRLEIDFTDEDKIKNTAEHCSINAPIDLVIVTTGLLHKDSFISPEKSLRDINAKSLQEVLHVNAIGPALVMKHFLPKMNKTQKSVFATLSARVGSISDNQLGGWYAYRSSKAALNMMIKTASIEMSRQNKNLSVIGLHPGTVNTNLSSPFQGNTKASKLFTPEESAMHLLNVINNLSFTDTGKIIAWNGQEIAP